MPEHKKTIPIAVLALLSAGLFLGGIATNLISNDIEEPLQALLGEHYRLVLTVTCLILALASGYLALRQIKERDTSLDNEIGLAGISISGLDSVASGASKLVAGRDLIVNGGDFVAHDKVTVVSIDQISIESQVAYRERPTLGEVIAELNAQPPFQRTTIAVHYQGVKVSWHLFFLDIREEATNSYIILLRAPDIIGVVNAKIDIRKYPETKVLREGHPVHARGEISKINTDLSVITLTDCTFTFA